MTGTTILTGPARAYTRAHINTDEIIPARYLTTSDETELAKHAMEDIDPEFAGTVEPGTILVVGEDFGCGSSREHAVWSLRAAGVQAVVGESFARIFFRNAINNGFRAVECPGVADAVRDGETVELDMEAGELRIPARQVSLAIVPAGEHAERIIAAGGLMPYVAAHRTPEATAPADPNSNSNSNSNSGSDSDSDSDSNSGSGSGSGAASAAAGGSS